MHSSSPRPEVVCVIPARGASKGIPRKNIRMIGGKPLIQYSIEAARAASGIGRILVSTDSREIADVALGLGAEVPFLRPEHLASDTIEASKAIDHLIGSLYPLERRPVTVTLYPTSPFRPAGMIDTAVDLALRGAHTVQFAKRCSPGRFYVPSTGAWGEDDRSFYRSYGLVSIYNPYAPTGRHAIIAIDNSIWLLDIDTPKDLRLARRVVEQGLYRPEEPMTGYVCI